MTTDPAPIGVPLGTASPSHFGSSVEKLGRHPELDGARGLAVILVVFWHYASSTADQWLASAPQVLSVPFNLTWSGVDLFFVLSGYLICRQLWARGDRRMPTCTFYLNRVRRIVPLYFLMLCLYLIGLITPLVSVPELKNLFTHPLPLWSYFIFAQNYFMAARTNWGGVFMSVTWAVAFEMQFYALAPWFAKILPLRRLPLACICGILLALGLREIGPQAQDRLLPFWHAHLFQSYILHPWRSDALLFGAILIWAELNGNFIRIMRRFGTVCLLLSGALLWLRGWQDPNLFQFNYLFTALFYGVLIACLLINKQSWLASIFRMGWLRACGRFSYGIYLFHLPTLSLVMFLSNRILARPAAVLSAGVSVIITVLLASVSYKFYESKFLAK